MKSPMNFVDINNDHDEELLLIIAWYLKVTVKLTCNVKFGKTFVKQLTINCYTSPAVLQLIKNFTDYPLFITNPKGLILNYIKM